MAKRYAIDAGHSTGAGATGGGFVEAKLNREIVTPLINYLAGAGHVVSNCTNNSAHKQLSGIVNCFNDGHRDICVSIHFNKGGGNGMEIFTKGGNHYPEATRVLSKINAMGLNTSRGIKNGDHLYVIRNSNHRTMLVEVLFLDNSSNINFWKANGGKKVAKAIAEGITGKTISDDGTTTPDAPSVPDVPAVNPNLAVYQSAYDRVSAFITQRNGVAPQKRFLEKMKRSEAFSLLNRMTDKKYYDDLCGYFPELCYSEDPIPPPIQAPIPPPTDLPDLVLDTVEEVKAKGGTLGDQCVALAHTHVGKVLYQWGGNSILYKGHFGADCSHFTFGIMVQVGIMKATGPKKLGGYLVAADQRTVSLRYMKKAGVLKGQYKGDLVFYGAPATHVAFNIGNGMRIDSGGGGEKNTTAAYSRRRGSIGRIKAITADHRRRSFGRMPGYGY